MSEKGLNIFIAITAAITAILITIACFKIPDLLSITEKDVEKCKQICAPRNVQIITNTGCYCER